MAISDILQIIADARVDARSLSEFVFKPADFMVNRRLSPPINTLNFYIDRISSVNASVIAVQQSVAAADALIDNNATQAADAVSDAIEGVAIDANLVTDALIKTVPKLGGVARNQKSINDERVSIKDFGIVGDGVADDTDGVEKAIQLGQSIDWLDVKCKITRPISTTYPKGSVIKWYGKGATITYAGAHTECVVRLSGAGVKYDLSGQVSIICGKLANKGLEVLNNSASMADDELSYFVADNLKIIGVKRLKAFGGGDALFVRGGFSAVELRSGCEFFDVELPALQGTSGVIGVSGVTVSHYGLTGYCKEVICDGAKISKVYSSDLDYYDDQDGLRYLCPKDASGNIVVSKLTVTSKSKFKNCYGRSIKTQCMFTDVKSASFERSEGGNLGYGNPEIDAQFGYLNIGSLTFIYSNGFTASTCIASSTDADQKVSGFNIDDVQVFLEAGTVLRTFASTFPRDGEIVPSTINNVKIFGTVEVPISYLCNGSKNKLEVSNFYVEKFADVNYRGTPKGLITVITSGSITPYRALVVAHNNSTADTTSPAIVVDRVAGNSMTATTSMWSNIGFLDGNSISYGSDNVNTMQVNRSGLIGKKFVQDSSNQNSGAFGIQETVPIASGATVRIPARTSGGCKVDIVAAYNKTAFASLYVYGKTIAVIAKGVPFEVADAIEPATGLFRVWAENTNEICIKNTDASSRVFTVFVISNY